MREPFEFKIIRAYQKFRDYNFWYAIVVKCVNRCNRILNWNNERKLRRADEARRIRHNIYKHLKKEFGDDTN